MELAGGIESLLVGEGRLPSRPAALLLGSGPLFGLLIFNCCHLPAGDSNRCPYQNDHKRKAPMPPSTSRQVATVEDEQPEERPAPKKKGGRPAWQPAFSYEQTLDAPASSTAA